jgi:uncharacterized protein (TIGR02145 family)
MRLFTIIILFFISFTPHLFSSGFPDGISYQGVALDKDGNELAVQTISIRFSILGQPDASSSPLYQETHSTATDNRGLFSVVIGKGTPSSGTGLSAIDWGKGNLYLMVEIDAANGTQFRLMGMQQMMSVPFAMHALGADSRLLQAGASRDSEEAIFQVVNSNGDVVFAVWESGVELNIDGDAAKGSRGGFAVGGFSSGKQVDGFEYFRVDPGFVQVTIDDDPAKGSRGGFAVGGFSSSKTGLDQNYFDLTPGSALFNLDNDYVTIKGSRSGFAVGGFSSLKGDLITEYLRVSFDSIRVYIDPNVSGKGSRGGFAVGGFSSMKGDGFDYLHVDHGLVEVTIDDLISGKGSRGGFAVGGFSSSKTGSGTDFLSITPGNSLFNLDIDYTTDGKGSRGGFAVGGFSSTGKSDFITDFLHASYDSVILKIEDAGKGSGGFAVQGVSGGMVDALDILHVTPGATEIYTIDGSKKFMGGFTVFGLDTVTQVMTDLFQVTQQMTTVSTVFAVVPTLITSEITDITTHSARGGGNITGDGDAAVTGRGLVWSLDPRPRIDTAEPAMIAIAGEGTGEFAVDMTGLVPGRTYYVRAWATNKAGTAYGNEQLFHTNNILTPIAGTNGRIEPAEPVEVAWGTVSEFLIIPDIDYEIDDVLLGEVSVIDSINIDFFSGTGTYKLKYDFEGEITISASFKEASYQLTDIDNNKYRTITIGQQEWMAENLRTTRFRNGNPMVKSDEPTWTGNTEGAYIIYDHTPVEGIDTEIQMAGYYGLLYNIAAVDDLSGLCPAGWYVPAIEDWDILVEYLGGQSIAGGKLKSTRTYPDAHPRWNSPNEGATNESGFNGLPGGMIEGSYGLWGLGNSGYWWTSSRKEDEYYGEYKNGGYELPQMVNLDTWGTNIYYQPDYYGSGLSVRCINGFGIPRVSTGLVLSMTTTTAVLDGIILDEGDSELVSIGFVWGTTPDPDIETGAGNSSITPVMGKFSGEITGLEPATKYFARVYATNASGKTRYGNTVSFSTYHGTVNDAEGNSYFTVMIGDRLWMAENLKTAIYNNADSIPTDIDGATWSAATEGAYAVYDNDTANNDIYGKLYNWHAVNDTRGICPAGWIVPQDEDWKDLEFTLGMSFYDVDMDSYRGTDQGGKMKVPGFGFWASPNTGATNESGFTALPGGSRDSWDGVFYGIAYNAYFWTSTRHETYQDQSWSRQLETYGSRIGRYSTVNTTGASVRCVLAKEEPQVKTLPVADVTVNSAIGGGEIYGTGEVTGWGIVWDTISYPTMDRHLGMSSGILDSVSFASELSNLEASTEYFVRAYAVNNYGVGYGRNYSFKTYLGTVDDISGNSYRTVMIGNQIWMADNLKTTMYSNGGLVEFPLTNTEWANNITGAYAWLKNDEAVGSIYGGLYNWHAVNNPAGLCPAGWHVASDDDWIEMEIYLGMDSIQAREYGGRYSEIGGKLKQSGLETWQSPNSGATNETRFTALPGDMRYSDGSSYDPGWDAYFWTSTTNEWETPYCRNLRSNNVYIYRYDMDKKNGMSVRCIYSEGKPLVFTLPDPYVADSSATVKGHVTHEGGTGLSAVGMVWSRSNEPDLENNEGFTTEALVTGEFETILKGLEPGETYYARAYATSTDGKTGYGALITFTTFFGKANDADGNLYYSIKIGDQEWMNRNLRTSSYAGGVSITTGLTDNDWAITTEGAFSVYPYQELEGIISSEEMLEAYGALYNWFAVETGNLCPAGWKVPDETDWTQLKNYVTSVYYSNIGRPLKSCRQDYYSPLPGCTTSEHPRWEYYSYSYYGTDNFGFGGLPGGARDGSYGSYSYLGYQGYLWSATMQSELDAYRHNLSFSSHDLTLWQSSKNTGYSVRCLKIQE